MFAKLLKHEWRATRGLLGVLSLAALGVGVAATVVLRLLTGGLFSERGELSAVQVSLVVLMVFLVFALMAYAFACQIILLVRFYKSRFTDEGYLTFTLPVTSREIFLSSAVNMMIWTVISSLVLMVAAALILALGIPAQEWVAGDFWGEVSYIGGSISPVTVVLQVVATLVYAPSLTLTCLTCGAVWAKKHKILMAFGAYYIISMIVGTISSAVMMVPLMSDPYYYLLVETDLLSLVQSIIQIAVAVGSFFLSTHLMNKKLNLP